MKARSIAMPTGRAHGLFPALPDTPDATPKRQMIGQQKQSQAVSIDGSLSARQSAEQRVAQISWRVNCGRNVATKLSGARMDVAGDMGKASAD
jgi:hypothetical protein